MDKFGLIGVALFALALMTSCREGEPYEGVRKPLENQSNERMGSPREPQSKSAPAADPTEGWDEVAGGIEIYEETIESPSGETAESPSGETAEVNPTGCFGDLSATDNRRVQCDGITYTLSVPEDCTGGGCGLIMGVHGATMSAQSMNGVTNMRALGRDAVSRGASTPYIVLQPSASGRSWDIRRFSMNDKFRKTLETAITAFAVDKRRVHFHGFSQGGMSTSRMICSAKDLLASVGIIAGWDVPCDLPEVPVHITHGDGDSLVAKRYAVRNVEKCKEATGDTSGTMIEEGGRYTITRYEGNGKKCVYVDHQFRGSVGGHCVLGFGGTYGCRSDLKTGEQLIDFYIANPKS